MGMKEKSGAKIKKIGEIFNKKQLDPSPDILMAIPYHCVTSLPPQEQNIRKIETVSIWGKAKQRSGCEYWSENSWIKLTTTWLPDC